MIQFYSPNIETALCLPESDSKHCCRVLRLRAGDEIEVTDGCGNRFVCRLLDDNPKKTSLEIVSRVRIEPSWNNFITLMIAPTKLNDRMEWLVEKAVEVGINRIVPVRCQHSERKEIKTERLEKIAISAMKQSLKAIIPEITPMLPLKEALDAYRAPQCFVGYCDDNTPRRLLAKRYKANKDVCLLIGPEGDFSPVEISMLTGNGYEPVTLGDNRLRTETAALVAITTCHVINQLES